MHLFSRCVKYIPDLLGRLVHELVIDNPLMKAGMTPYLLGGGHMQADDQPL